MARIFVVTINYAPEPSGFAPHATQIAEHFARRGHKVSVFTGFSFAPSWHRRPEDRGRLFSRVRNGNLTVRRVTHYIPRRPSSVFQRILMEGSFSLSALMAVLAAILGSAGRPDAVLYIGAQPAVAMLARIVAGLARCPYVVMITDLAARAALDVGMVGGQLSRLLEKFEFAAYRPAAGAIVLCDPFAQALVQHRYPLGRIRVIPSPVDVELVRPVPRTGTFRARHAISEDALLVMHAGSMGLKQGLFNVVAAARLTRDTNICWVLVGEGEAMSDLTEATRRDDLGHRVLFVPFQPDGAIAEMFAAADVLLLNQLAAVKDTVIPSKLLTYMAAGRPVLAAVNPGSQAARLLGEADGGVLVAPEDPNALAEAARWFSTADPVVLAAFSQRNRAYAEQHFDQRNIIAAHEHFILDTLRVPLRSNPGPTAARR